MLFGAAVYERELTAAEVLKHYQTWTQQGRPEIDASERCRALYLFDEHAGTVVHSRVEPGIDLRIPARYLVVDKKFWSLSGRSSAYPGLMGARLSKTSLALSPSVLSSSPICQECAASGGQHWSRLLLGTLISLTIEVLQGFLPTRDSGTTDLITNTLGTWLGVLLYLRLHRWAGCDVSVAAPVSPAPPVRFRHTGNRNPSMSSGRSIRRWISCAEPDSGC